MNQFGDALRSKKRLIIGMCPLAVLLVASASRAGAVKDIGATSLDVTGVAPYPNGSQVFSCINGVGMNETRVFGTDTCGHDLCSIIRSPGLGTTIMASDIGSQVACHPIAGCEMHHHKTATRNPNSEAGEWVWGSPSTCWTTNFNTMQCLSIHDSQTQTRLSGQSCTGVQHIIRGVGIGGATLPN